jgi:hydrogenase nickel incorporation protein HypA/HybF
MHEKALLDDLLAKILEVADAEGGVSVTRIRVHLGALSHFTPGHFREHFVDAARGTLAEGAEVEAELGDDPADPRAQGVVLESVDVEVRREPSAAT